MRRAIILGVVIVLVAFTAALTRAQPAGGKIAERVLLDNDTIRLVLITYQPGADRTCT